MQAKKIEFLNKSISDCETFKSAPVDSTLILPTGDGMAIGFLQGPELPLKLAIELQGRINKHNRGKLPNETIQVRIGIHSGPVFVVKDIRGNNNIWGPGIIMARRIMDIGDDGHILLSGRVAEDLRQLSHQYSQLIHPLDKYTVKHNVQVMIYSAFSKEFGNAELPAKIRKRMDEFLYPYVEVEMQLLDLQTMKIRYKRTYELQNMGDTPMHAIIHQIATDVEKSLEDLRIKIFDEKNRPLLISSVELNTAHQKQFATSLAQPLAKGEKITYFLEYEVEEPEKYFENAFYTNCQRFVLLFNYPSEHAIKPVAYEVNTETDQSELIHPIPADNAVSERTIQKWELESVIKGRSVRIEW